jgi:hypothetical protein
MIGTDLVQPKARMKDAKGNNPTYEFHVEL